jgi:hypothetical protein
VQVVDEQALAAPAPRNIRLYLRIHGWERQGQGAGPDVWSRTTPDGTYEVIAPSAREARDFRQRVGELLRTLSVAEDRSELDVLRDLATLSFDIQYVHADYPGPPGTAPLRDASAAFAAAHAMLSASTAALEEPRLVLPPRRPSRTADFMKKVLAGPTSEGSYVISIWVPVPPRLTQDEDAVLFDDLSEPFERAATKHLSRALGSVRAAAREALNSDAGLDAFIARESEGVSANLCEALVEFAGEAEVGFDVQFAWALDRPVMGVEQTVGFDSDAVPILREAARELRARLPEDEVRIRGNVVRLHREGQLGAGEVTVAGLVVGDPLEKLRRVSVSLAEPDYERAIQAHQTYSDVEMVGSLIQRGTRTYLTDARGFAVRAPDDGEQQSGTPS